jgi:hypothetical protein
VIFIGKNGSPYLLAFCRGHIAFRCGRIGVMSRPYQRFGVILFHHVKTVKNGNGRHQNLFVATYFAITELDLKPWLHTQGPIFEIDEENDRLKS